VGVPAVRRGASAGRLGAARDARAPRPGSAAGQLNTARVNGTEIAYEVTGSGPAVVFLHAGVGDRRLWDGQVEAFAERYLAVRPDLRGFGESPLPGGPFSYVEDVRALLDELDLDRFALVGNSFGGKVALDVALAEPERTRALVLVAPALTGYEGSAELEALDEEEDTLLDAGRIDEAVELNVRTWLDGRGREAAPVPPETRERLAAMQRRSFDVIVPAYEATPPPGPVTWSEPPASARLGEIAAPTLVLTGAHDVEDFRTAIPDLLAAGIPRVERAVMETGHLAALERPEEFNLLAFDFLARNDF
jgi:pimeloyl-ACP methyl ester carboxylesterase